MTKIRIIERGFLKGQRIYEKPARWTDADKVIEELAEEHAQAMLSNDLDMIELEFPDCPEHDRFFRIGTNPSGMVMPVERRPDRRSKD